jgi:RNA polymerase sigma factor (sigma-70 family)
MTDSPTTHPSLLVRLCDPRDAAAWGLFVELYAPPVYAFARRHGLQDADAADLTQDVLRSVSRAFGRGVFDPSFGSFRGWLFTVVGNRLRDVFDARRRQPRASGDTAAHERLAAVPDPGPDPAALWDQECERRLFDWAAEQVRGRFSAATWKAFWRTAVEGQAGQEVAQALGLSVAAVYLAKGRVVAALKEQIRLAKGNDE